MTPEEEFQLTADLGALLVAGAPSEEVDFFEDSIRAFDQFFDMLGLGESK